jgi:hypothetical protein
VRRLREDPADLCQFAATSTATIQALIDRGVNVHELRISDDSTPLHVAAWSCRDADVFEMLVKVCGIDLEARNRSDETCLHYAARSGNDFSLRWLLNAGADMNCVRRNGSTPLHDANLHSGAVILLAAGANVCARDSNGQTALHRVVGACRAGRLPRRDSTLCDIEHLNFVLAFNRCGSTRFKGAKSCDLRVVPLRSSFRFTSGGRLRLR